MQRRVRSAASSLDEVGRVDIIQMPVEQAATHPANVLRKSDLPLFFGVLEVLSPFLQKHPLCSSLLDWFLKARAFNRVWGWVHQWAWESPEIPGNVSRLWCVYIYFFFQEIVDSFYQIFKLLLDPQKFKWPPLEYILLRPAGMPALDRLPQWVSRITSPQTSSCPSTSKAPHSVPGSFSIAVPTPRLLLPQGEPESDLVVPMHNSLL